MTKAYVRYLLGLRLLFLADPNSIFLSGVGDVRAKMNALIAFAAALENTCQNFVFGEIQRAWMETEIPPMYTKTEPTLNVQIARMDFTKYLKITHKQLAIAARIVNLVNTALLRVCKHKTVNARNALSACHIFANTFILIFLFFINVLYIHDQISYLLHLALQFYDRTISK